MYVQWYQVQPKIFSTKFDKIFHFLFKGLFWFFGRNTGLVWVIVSKNYDLKQNLFYSKACISRSFSRLFTLEQKHKQTLSKMCVFYIFRYFQSSVSFWVSSPHSKKTFLNACPSFSIHVSLFYQFFVNFFGDSFLVRFSVSFSVSFFVQFHMNRDLAEDNLLEIAFLFCWLWLFFLLRWLNAWTTYSRPFM